MTIDEIKGVLKKKAIIFETDTCYPNNNIFQSWIGKVSLDLSKKNRPIDKDGNLMFPLMQLYIQNFKIVPELLKKIKFLSIFISSNFYRNTHNLDGYFCVHEYSDIDEMKRKVFFTKPDFIKPLPIFPNVVENDFPAWYSYDIPSNILDEILYLEKHDGIEYFEDIAEKIYVNHKLGGYPSYIQSIKHLDNDYEFIFQITSDQKACFNIIERGNLYFFKNKINGNWKCICDFY